MGGIRTKEYSSNPRKTEKLSAEIAASKRRNYPVKKEFQEANVLSILWQNCIGEIQDLPLLWRSPPTHSKTNNC